MTIKQYLRRIERLDEIVKSKLEQIDRLRDLLTKITSCPSIDGVKTNNNPDKIGVTVAKIVDLENEINKTVNELIDLKREVIRMIDSVETADCRLLLTLRYINGKTWEEIAEEMNLSYQWVSGRLHNQALVALDNVLRKEKAKKLVAENF